MTASKFKVGDEVVGNGKASRYHITKRDWRGKVIAVKSDTEIEVIGPGITFGVTVDSECFDLIGKRAEKILTPKFILQYDLDTDPFEIFSTEKELRSRIAELADRSDLKRDSIKVYDIKRVRNVKLGVKISISK